MVSVASAGGRRVRVVVSVVLLVLSRVLGWVLSRRPRPVTLLLGGAALVWMVGAWFAAGTSMEAPSGSPARVSSSAVRLAAASGPVLAAPPQDGGGSAAAGGSPGGSSSNDSQKASGAPKQSPSNNSSSGGSASGGSNASGSNGSANSGDTAQAAGHKSTPDPGSGGGQTGSTTTAAHPASQPAPANNGSTDPGPPQGVARPSPSNNDGSGNGGTTDDTTARPVNANGQQDQSGGTNVAKPAVLTDQQNGGTTPGQARQDQQADPSKPVRPSPLAPGKPDPMTGSTTPPGKPVDGQRTDSAGMCVGGGTGCATGGPPESVAVNPDQKGGTAPGVRVGVDSSSQIGGCQGSSPCGTDGAHRPGLPGVSGSQSGAASAAGQSQVGQTDDPAGVHPRGPLMFGKGGASTGTTSTGTSDGRGKPSGQCGAGGDCAPAPGQHPAVPTGPSNVNGGQGGSTNTGSGGSGAAVQTDQDSTGDTKRAQLAAGRPQQDPQTGERSMASQRGPPASPDTRTEASPNTQETRVRAMADAHARTVATETDTVGDKPAPLGAAKATPALDKQARTNKNSKDTATAPAVDDRKTPQPAQPGLPGRPGTPAGPVGGSHTEGGTDTPVDAVGKPNLMFPGGNHGGSSESGAGTGTALGTIRGHGTQQPCTGDTCGGQGQPAPAAPAPGPNGGQSNMDGGQGGAGHGPGPTATHDDSQAPIKTGVQLASSRTEQSSLDPKVSSKQGRGPPAGGVTAPKTDTAPNGGVERPVKLAVQKTPLGSGDQSSEDDSAKPKPVINKDGQRVGFMVPGPGGTSTFQPNLGQRNHGVGNDGDDNDGDGNTGSRNHGNANTGNDNTGHRNQGNANQGNDNQGNDNQGDRNVGDRNVGSDNTGSGNTGSGNRGNDNVGNSNSGDRNIGDHNSGSDNEGNGNSGSWNHGNNNSGSGNDGDNHSGDNAGHFCILCSGYGNDGFLISGNRNNGAGIAGNRNNGAGIAGDDNNGVGIAGRDNNGAGIAGSDNNGAFIQGEQNNGASIAGNGNNGALIAGDQNNGVLIAGDQNNGALIHGDRNKGAVIQGDDNTGAAIDGNRNNGAGIIRGNDNNGAFIIGDRNDGAFILGDDNTGAFISGDRNHGAVIQGYDNNGAVINGNRNRGTFIYGDGDNPPNPDKRGTIRFAEGQGKTALTPDRLQHGTYHLTKEGILPPWSGTKSPAIIQEKLAPILEHPKATFDHTLGKDPVKGFLGEIDGKEVAVFVYKAGKNRGKLATSFVPTPNQLAKWGVK